MGKGREPQESSQSMGKLCVRGWRGTILGFAGHGVFVSTTELCHGSVKAATEYVSGWVWLCSYTKTGVGGSGHSWPIPGITGGLTCGREGVGEGGRTLRQMSA